MYVKIFSSIYDGSLCNHWESMVVFQQLLILANRHGDVDMTPEAIHNRTKIPISMIESALDFLSSPDPKSRNKKEDGRRIIPLDENREWGWHIVNYEYYRGLKTEEDKREKWLKDKARQRSAKNQMSTEVHPVPPDSTHADTDPSKEHVFEKPKRETSKEVFELVAVPSDKFPGSTFPAVLEKWIDRRMGMGKKPKCGWRQFFQDQLEWLVQFKEPEAIEILSASTRNNWTGLFENKVKPHETRKPNSNTGTINENSKSTYAIKERLRPA